MGLRVGFSVTKCNPVRYYRCARTGTLLMPMYIYRSIHSQLADVWLRVASVCEPVSRRWSANRGSARLGMDRFGSALAGMWPWPGHVKTHSADRQEFEIIENKTRLATKPRKD